MTGIKRGRSKLDMLSVTPAIIDLYRSGLGLVARLLLSVSRLPGTLFVECMP